MRVVVVLTITGDKETIIEGDADFNRGHALDALEERDIGFWLDNYRFVEPQGRRHRKGRVFCPWSSVLFVEEVG